MSERIEHPFPPLFDSQSSILILGSFPSVKSRENQFFYGHPQNRFWKVMAAVLNETLPSSVDEKRCMLLSHRIALWDCIASCEIIGSSDSSIKNVVPNELSIILNNAHISVIFCNGKKAHELYRRFIQKELGREAICLPSTSPANATWTTEKLISEYSSCLSPYLSPPQNTIY